MIYKKNNVNILQKKTISLKKKGRIIGLCHGVFDLIHSGHIEHFKEAKKYCDILIVSLTSDKYVDKGLNRPIYNQNKRAEILKSINLINDVYINEERSSVNIIKNLKPNFYIKGPDYLVKKNDDAGNLIAERKAVELNKGKIIFTSGKKLSSTNLIYKEFDSFKSFENILKKIPKKNKIELSKNLDRSLELLKNLKILIIGEIIFDNYIYTSGLGKPSKENILSVKYQKDELYLGGAYPVAKNLSELSRKVDLLTYVSSKNLNQIKKKNNKDSFNLKGLITKEYKDIFKRRFVNEKTITKIFEYYEFNDQIYDNSKLLNFIKKNISNYDLVVVCDFGHGMLNDSVIELLEKKSKYLCANVQTNSGNRGYNLFTKYKKLNLLCIDEPELRLGLSDKFNKLENCIKNNRMKGYKQIAITRGVDGMCFFNKNNFINYPALNSKTVDTIGAGDTLFAYLSAFSKVSNNYHLNCLIGSISAALKTNIVGNSETVKIKDIKDTLKSFLKN